MNHAIFSLTRFLTLSSSLFIFYFHTTKLIELGNDNRSKGTSNLINRSTIFFREFLAKTVVPRLGTRQCKLQNEV